MSKDFKSEYENQLDFEIPDLWSRIEPQLHEKIAQPMATQVNAWQPNVQQPMVAQAPVNMQQPQVVVKQKNKLRRIYAYSGIAVACLCVVIAIPVLMGNMDRKDASNDMVAMDSAVSEESVNENTTAGWNDMAMGSADADMDMEMDMDTSSESATQTDDCVVEDGTASDSDAEVSDAQTAAPEEMLTPDAENSMMDADADAEAEADEEAESWEGEVESVRLPEDTGEVLEIYGTVTAFSAGDGSVLYEILVTEVDSDMISYDTESVILAEWLLTEEQLSAPESEYRLSDEVRLRIQWNEERQNYCILEAL